MSWFSLKKSAPVTQANPTGKRVGKTRLVGTVAAAAIAIVGTYEGLSLTAYKDIVGVPTVCFGETRGVNMGDRYTKAECQTMLGDGLKDFEGRMRACLTAPDQIPDGPYVAFLSLSYNIGSGAFCKSTLVRKANAGDIKGACDQLLNWNRAGGKVVKGLTNRRQDERKICLEGLAK
jgi:lysozyme